MREICFCSRIDKVSKREPVSSSPGRDETEEVQTSARAGTRSLIRTEQTSVVPRRATVLGRKEVRQM
jgi:hypothetical protein